MVYKTKDLYIFIIYQ